MAPFLAFLGSAGSAVGSAAGAVGSAVGSAASAIGSAVGSAASSVGSALGVGGAGTGAGATTGAAAGAGGTSLTAAIPNTLMAGASLLKGFGEYRANQANSDISKVQSKQAKLNAAYDERRQREESTRLMGEQQARFGASGVAMEGTPLLVMADQARQSELDALAIRHQGAQAAQAYKSEARGYRRAATHSLMGGVLNAAAYGAGAYHKYKNPSYR